MMCDDVLSLARDVRMWRQLTANITCVDEGKEPGRKGAYAKKSEKWKNKYFLRDFKKRGQEKTHAVRVLPLPDDLGNTYTLRIYVLSYWTPVRPKATCHYTFLWQTAKAALQYCQRSDQGKLIISGGEYRTRTADLYVSFLN